MTMQRVGRRSRVSRYSSPFSARICLAIFATIGLVFGVLAGSQANPTSAAPAQQLPRSEEFSALRVHGYPVVSNPNRPAEGNDPATAGANGLTDPNTGQIPEDPPYTDMDGPFDPFSSEAPEMDAVTWNPAWISERLADPDFQDSWPGLDGIDEVSRSSNIRASSINASEKVWLRHWYEPYHLDVDLNADGRLTDEDNDGIPDARMNPAPSSIDEWHPSIMAELTYMLTDNDPVPMADVTADTLHRSAPRPTCGRPGATSIVFPVGTSEEATQPDGPLSGEGLTSLDADFDGELDMVRVADETTLPSVLGGMEIDFDGDGTLDALDADGTQLSCDELVVLHTESLSVTAGEKLQFLDHFITLEAVSDNGAVIQVWNNYGLRPRAIQSRSLGIGGAVLAGDTGPLMTLAPGGSNLGTVPPGAWFAYLADADADNDSAIIVLGRALGAPCASMQDGPTTPNLSPGGPWFLKRMYVDAHEYNLSAIGTCPNGDFRYLSLRSVLPKTPVTIEQHSVQLQSYAIEDPRDLPWLPLPPPFNHEHTILEDVTALDGFDDLDPAPETDIRRPIIRYMGGPIGPSAPVVPAESQLPYMGLLEDVGPYDQVRESRWTYVHETVNPAMRGQMRERLGARPDGQILPPPTPPRDFGDAPSELGYPTLLADDGARHLLPAGGPILGSCVDAEFEGQPDLAANGDDSLGSCPDDGDGIAMMSDVRPEQTTDLRISTQGSPSTGFLQAFIDFNRDGDWDDDGEQVVSDLQLSALSLTPRGMLFETPRGTEPGPTYMRLRISTQAGIGPTGQAPDGEVEDYRIDILASLCPFQPIDSFTNTNDPLLGTFAMVDASNPGPLVILDNVDPLETIGGQRRVTLGPYTGGLLGAPLNQVMTRVDTGRLEFVANPDSQADIELFYDANGTGLGASLVGSDRIRLFYLFDDGGTLGSSQITIILNDGTNSATLTQAVLAGSMPFQTDFLFANFTGIGALDLSSLDNIQVTFNTSSAQDFVLDSIRPCLGDIPVSNPTPIGATPGPSPTPGQPTPTPVASPTPMDLPDFDQQCFFYNEQVFTLPWHYTEFILPDLPEPPSRPFSMNPDAYHLVSAFDAPTSRWRRWTMPGGPLPIDIPPVPSDLTVDLTEPPGANRRAAFWFDPDNPDDQPVKLWLDETGARLYGGQPETDFAPGCDPDRPALLAAPGNPAITEDRLDANYPVEVRPYTDPWAPFSPQHPHAPPGDILSVNPAYMDEFRNFNEDLADLYRQISNNGQNAREKVYHRIWYEPDHLAKIRFADDCERDLSYSALMQEFTYLYLDTTDTPMAAPPGLSRFGFPVGTRAEELPEPQPGGILPNVPDSELGYGLTTFDANFDGWPDAVTIHSEETFDEYLETSWQSKRPRIPGNPPATVNGPSLDFDGDGILDELDSDDILMNGDEMVVFAIEDLVLDLDPATEPSSSAMFLDHLVTVENVTRGQRAQVRFWFTGGSGGGSFPEVVGGVRSLDIGDAAIVDRFQDRVTIIHPGEQNPGVDGAWFVFLKDVATVEDQITISIGRALGATHTAIDDGAGQHDMLAGDPWYLKRFYVDGHVYDTTALMIQPRLDSNELDFDDLFKFITIRTAVPTERYFNPQETLWLQGYSMGDDPDVASVMPPFNVDHTIVQDFERQEADDFAHTRRYSNCVGPLAPFGPLEERFVAKGVEERYGSELREIHDSDGAGFRWQTDQNQVIPNEYCDIQVSEGQTYLYTSNWTSSVSRLHFYGCLRGSNLDTPGDVDIIQQGLVALARGWGFGDEFIPMANELDPPQPDEEILDGGGPFVADYYDARLGREPVRVKLFYDPSEQMNDIYVTRGRIPWGIPLLGLGDTIFMDNDDDGVFEPGVGEIGVAGVTVQLFEDTDDSGDYGSGVDLLLDETVTNVDGRYAFIDLDEGDYIVVVPASNFALGGPLAGKQSSLGALAAADPDDDQDNDDNGAPAGGGDVASAALTLSEGGEPEGGGDENPTLDLGFSLIPPPTNTPDPSVPTNTPDPSVPTNTPDPSVPTNTPDPSVPTNTPDPSVPTNTPDPSVPTNTPDPSVPTNTPVPTATPTITPTLVPQDELCLGDLVWRDANDNGQVDVGESGIPDVIVDLYEDTNGSGDFSPGTDDFIARDRTDYLGGYSFCALDEGDYVLVLPASNFGIDGALRDGRSSLGDAAAPDPDDDVNNDDNGQPLLGVIVSRAVTLSLGDEPIDDGDSDPNTNRSVDFGIVMPAPTATPTDRPTRPPQITLTPEPVEPTSTTVPGGPSSTPRPTQTSVPGPTFTPTQVPTAAPFEVSCAAVDGDATRVKVNWTDATNFESEFVLAVSVDGSDYVALDQTVPSNSRRGTGRAYEYTTPNLLANMSLRFQVQGRDAMSGVSSSFSAPSAVCRTERKPAESLGCYSGSVSMQGRSNHDGAWIRYDGFPVIQTGRSGSFRFCGAKAGAHRISAAAGCYLNSNAAPLRVGGGGEARLGNTDLYGGDVNADMKINLFDLVRVGRTYNVAPPKDPAADCTGDGKVDLFDLVLVSRNYGIEGPLAWGENLVLNEDGAVIDSETRQPAFALDAEGTETLGSTPTKLRGLAGGSPLELRERLLDEDTIAVDIVVKNASALYGADLTLVFDPARVAVVDARPSTRGIQIEPGSVWTLQQSFIAANAVVPSSDGNEGQHQIRFAASLMQPAQPVSGDAELASVTFRILDAEAGTEGAFALAGVALSDERGREASARWDGFDLRMIERLLMPWLGSGAPSSEAP